MCKFEQFKLGFLDTFHIYILQESLVVEYVSIHQKFMFIFIYAI